MNVVDRAARLAMVANDGTNRDDEKCGFTGARPKADRRKRRQDGDRRCRPSP